MIIMLAAKVFMNGQSQAVRLPKEYRFTDSEVMSHKIGNMLLLLPKDEEWSGFLASLDMFSDDFMANGREQYILDERDDFE